MSRLVRAVDRRRHQRRARDLHQPRGPVRSIALHNAVKEAELKGVIVLCAAGNQVGFVVFPAAFDEVIAVAASRIDDTPWPGSCHGPGGSTSRPPGRRCGAARTERCRQHRAVQRRPRQRHVVHRRADGRASRPCGCSFHGRSCAHQLATDAIAWRRCSSSCCRRAAGLVAGWDTGEFGPGIAARSGAAAGAAAGRTAGARPSRPRAPRCIDLSGAVRGAGAPARAGSALGGRPRAEARLLNVDEARLPRPWTRWARNCPWPSVPTRPCGSGCSRPPAKNAPEGPRCRSARLARGSPCMGHHAG